MSVGRRLRGIAAFPEEPQTVPCSAAAGCLSMPPRIDYRRARLPLAVGESFGPDVPAMTAIGVIEERDRAVALAHGGRRVRRRRNSPTRAPAPRSCRADGAQHRPQVQPLRLIGARDVVDELLGPAFPVGDALDRGFDGGDEADRLVESAERSGVSFRCARIPRAVSPCASRSTARATAAGCPRPDRGRTG